MNRYNFAYMSVSTCCKGPYPTPTTVREDIFPIDFGSNHFKLCSGPHGRQPGTLSVVFVSLGLGTLSVVFVSLGLGTVVCLCPASTTAVFLMSTTATATAMMCLLGTRMLQVISQMARPTSTTMMMMMIMIMMMPLRHGDVNDEDDDTAVINDPSFS
jgi:hypothetical protein